MQKVVLQDIKSEQKTSKAGKPYTSCGIKVADIWYNGFGGKETATWKPGDTVMVQLYKEEYQGKQYDKFKAISETDMLSETVKVLVKEVKSLKERLNKLSPSPDDTLDLPF